MAKTPNPRTFIMTDIPDADLQEILDELREEDLFDVIEKTKQADGTWTLKLRRR
jgi:hypothetical protein